MQKPHGRWGASRLTQVKGMQGFRVAMAALLASLLLSTCASDRPPTEARTLHDLSNVSQLQAAFNREHGHPRLMLLLSPT
jgi:hypothetical protein